MEALVDRRDLTEGMETVGARELLMAVGALGTWLLLFTAGMIIPSTPYRELLASPVGLPLSKLLVAWLVVVTCYTLPNVALLCCSASLLGAAGRRARLERGEEPEDDGISSPYVSAVIRGFFVFLVLLSGVLILLEKPFDAPSAEQYLRLAGFVSLLSFLVGYNPHLFARLLKRIADLVEGHAGNGLG